MGLPTSTHLNPLSPILGTVRVLCQRRVQVFLFMPQQLTRVRKSGTQFSRRTLLNPALGCKSSETSRADRPDSAQRTQKRGELACKPGSVEGNHSSTNCVTAALQQPTRKHAGLTLAPSALRPPARLPYLALLQMGFSMPSSVTTDAVRSYRTVSPLPASLRILRRSILCCTFRGLTPPRRYLASCPPEPGLSSPLHPCGCHAAIAQPAPPRRTIAVRPRHCLLIAACRHDNPCRLHTWQSRSPRNTS